jgi:LuxR family maltose regulon positive regulatory protein
MSLDRAAAADEHGTRALSELFLSPHTIKSQMKSIYRKLGSSTRAQTVTRARELGLLEG